MLCRYAAENPSQASSNYLSLKVLALFREVLSTYAFPDLQRRLERFTPALSNSNALLLLRKGRKWVQSERMHVCKCAWAPTGAPHGT